MTLDHRLGEKLRQARLSASLTIADAAHRLRLSEFELTQSENGAVRVTPLIVHRAARTYGVEIRWFFATYPSNSRVNEDKVNEDEASNLILQSLRSNKTLSNLCEALRESDDAEKPRKFVA